MILIDMQGYQSLSKNRGIGRYTKEFVKALIKEYSDIALLFNASMDTSDIDEFESHRYFFYTTGIKEVDELIREKLIADINPNVLLITSLFEGFSDNSVVSIKKLADIPTALIVYDLIPLIYKEEFLQDEFYKNFYLEKIQNLKKADLALTISDSAKNELIKYLNFPENKITTIYAGSNIDTSNIKSFEYVKNIFGIKKEYFLYVSACDRRKNFKNLIEAFVEFKNEYDLVIVCNENDYQKELKQFAAFLNVDVIFTGFVDDAVLNTLYKNAKLLIYPSIHEGFGLPVLEAAAFSTPAVVSNTSSLPEVVGEGLMFDPYSPRDIADTIKKALNDYQNQIKIADNNFKRFSWSKSAKLAYNALIGFDKKDKKDYTEALIDKIAKLRKFSNEELILIAKTIEKNESEIFKLKIDIQGPFDSSYSLSLLNRQTALALTKLGYEVKLTSTEGYGDFEPDTKFLKENPQIKALYEKNFFPNVISRNLYPPRTDKMPSAVRMFHHYAWEESGFVPEWVENFNKDLTHLTTLSKHVQKIMIDNGVNLPMIVSGCGTDHILKVKSTPFKLPTLKKFKFLHISSCFPRKGCDVLLRAYKEAFSSKDDVSLIIKTFDNPHNNIEEILKEFDEDSPHVVLIKDDLKDGEIRYLYQISDCLVAPSKAEGFGLPMAEAMLNNCAVITTGWGGVLDFCNEKNSFLIDFTFQKAKTHFNLFDSVWAQPNKEHLKDILQKVYKKPTLLKEKLKNVKLDDFTWEKAALNIIKVMQKTYKTPKIGWISTWDEPCGLATYSAHFLKHFQNDITIFAPYSSESKTAIKCWDKNESKQNFDKLIQHIKQYNIDMIVVQFNYGLFNFAELSKLINSIPTIITMHSTKDPEYKSLREIKESLKKAKRIVVHSIADLNRLKKLGLVDNIMLFPHPLLEYMPKYKSFDFTLATFGFFLPNKGLIETIEAFKILKPKYPELKLKMLNSEYPLKISKELIKKASSMLIEGIELKTNFLSDEEVLDELSNSDIVLYPYQFSSESASGAVRYAISADKEIITTPLEIFDDIKDFSFQSGFSPEDIAIKIEEVIHHIQNDSQLIVNKRTIRRNYIKTHTYKTLAKRFENMIISLYNNG